MTPQGYFRADRPAYLAVAAAFVLFLAYSAPHQVHHSFEHSHSQRPTPCQAFAVAKGCHLQPTAAVDFSFQQTVSDWIVPVAEASVSHSLPSPVSQRAPPLV